MSGVEIIATRASVEERRAIVAHYERVTPLIVANFAGIPLVFEKHPQGIGGKVFFSNRADWHPHGIPPEVSQALVHTKKTVQPYPLCDAKTILAYVKRHDASGVHSWTCVPGRTVRGSCKIGTPLLRSSSTAAARSATTTPKWS